MRLFLYQADFKIRKKADAKKLLNMIDESDFGHAEQDFYWHDDEYDYYISPKRKEVYSRPIFCRGNIFNPYCQELNSLETIWKTRKFINAQWFTREAW